MALTADALRLLSLRLTRDITSVGIPALFEAQCAWALNDAMRSFVYGSELGHCDAGLLVVDTEEEQLIPQDITDRLYYVLDNFEDRHVVLSIDFKTLTPSLTAEWNGANCQWSFEARESQREVALFVLMIPSAFPWIAVIPRSFMEDHSGKKEGLGINFREVPFHGQKMNSLPSEVWPFTVPLSKLVDALQEHVNFSRNPSGGWRNPHTGIVIKTLPPHKLLTTKILLPSAIHHVNEFSTERTLWKAFKDHSNAYRIERAVIRPSVGDFHIVHVSTGQRAVIELKRSMARLGPAQTLRHSQSLTSDSNRIFTSLVQWDILLSTIGNAPKALFINRDNVPPHWFNDNVGGDVVSHEWRDSDGPYEDYIVPLDKENMRSFVRGVEKIMNRRLDAGHDLQAKEKIPYYHLSKDKIAAVLGDEEHQAASKAPLVEKPPRGDHKFSSRQYEACQERFFKQEIRRLNFGSLIRLGYHPSATHAFFMGSFGEPPSFHELDMQAPCILLNFAPIDYFDNFEPNDKSLRAMYYHTTMARRPSLYVLSPEPKLEGAGQGLHRFVVPSTNLGHTDRKFINAILTGSVPGSEAEDRAPYAIKLRDASRLDLWAVPETDLVSHLRTTWRNSSELTEDDGKNLQEVALEEEGTDLKDLICTKADVMDDLISMMSEKSTWSHRLKSMVTVVGDQPGAGDVAQEDIVERVVGEEEEDDEDEDEEEEWGE